MNPFARDKDLLDQRELFVIIVNFPLDQRADLFCVCFAGGDVSEMMNDRRHLAIDPLLDEGDGFGRKRFGQRRIAVGQIIEPARKQTRALFVRSLQRSPDAETHPQRNRGIRFNASSFSSFVDASRQAVHRSADRQKREMAAAVSSLFSIAAMYSASRYCKSGNRVEDRRARLRGKRVDEMKDKQLTANRLV